MSRTTIPPFLKPNDTIGIISTARAINKSDLAVAIQILESWNLNVKLGRTIGLQQNQFAGSDEERASDFNEMLTNQNIKAILCARGGYGTVRIVDQLLLHQLNENPKWICGYSDITVMHAAINKTGLASIHSSMPINFKSNSKEALESLKVALFGQGLKYSIQKDPKNKLGIARGKLIGGNLSVLYSIFNSPSDYDYEGAILFIEDLDEYLYHIDRMLMNLKRNGIFDKINGLIIGGFTEMNDNDIPFGQSAIDIIQSLTAEYSFPICYNFPAGHIDDNHTLILGAHCELSVQANGTNLSYSDD